MRAEPRGSGASSPKRSRARCPCYLATNRMQYCFFLRLLLPIFALLCGSVFATSTFAAEVEPAVSLKPAELVRIGKFAITNSMLVTWIVAAVIIVFAQLATRKIKAVPTGAQNFWEWLVESLYNFLESIIGRELVRKTFWFFATIFIFIRPVSLSFRLFGNVYAGESILEAMSTMVPALSWLIPIPFYFMEVLVGVVQALVFMLLTAVFTLLIAQHQPGHEPQG